MKPSGPGNPARPLEQYPSIMDSAMVAELLAINIKTVQLMARQGRIPARRLPGSRMYRFYKQEILEWLDRQVVEVVEEVGPFA